MKKDKKQELFIQDYKILRKNIIMTLMLINEIKEN